MSGLMSAIGTKQTFRVALHMSAFGVKRTSRWGIAVGRGRMKAGALLPPPAKPSHQQERFDARICPQVEA